MESELGQEFLRQIAACSDEVVDDQHLARPLQTGISKRMRRFQAWHYLILACVVFWLLFAIILIASGFFFLVVALAILTLLSVLVVGLAWAFQNDI